MAEYFGAQKDLELKTVAKVIRNHLGSEPTEEDKAHTGKIENDNFNLKYLLTFYGEVLGMMEKSYEGSKLKIEFNPEIKSF